MPSHFIYLLGPFIKGATLHCLFFSYAADYNTLDIEANVMCVYVYFFCMYIIYSKIKNKNKDCGWFSG